MKKSNKIILLTGMILLLAVTAVFNFLLTQNKDSNTTATPASFFEEHKSLRMTNRNVQLIELDSIINSDNASAEHIDEAVELKLRLTKNIELELLLETYIKSQGFDDAVVVIGIDSGNVNVFIDSDEITPANAIKIYTIFFEEAELPSKNVHIIPV